MAGEEEVKEDVEKGSILIVDNDPYSLDLLLRILTKQGFRVRTAPNDRRALLAARAEIPELILIGVERGGVDGYDACRRLKTEKSICDVPVMFISAQDDIEKAQGFRVGGVDYITKPIQPEETLARVSTHIALRKTQQSLQNQKALLEQEVEERRRAELALLESERRVQWIMDNAPAVIYVKDSEGKYQLVNKRFEQLFNLKRGDVVGKTDHDIFPTKVAEALYANDRALLRAGEARQLEEILLQDERVHTYLSVKFPLRDGEGKSYALCGISSDITERKEAEAALARAKEAAEAANYAKSSFLANMSHELRTPLNVILGFSQLLQRTPSLPPSASRHLKAINRSGEHLLSLINDILTVSKIEAGCLSLKESPFDFHDLLRDIEEMFTLRAEQKGIAFHMENFRMIPRHLFGDGGKLRQILINLLGNAVKFTDQGDVSLNIGCTPHSSRRWQVAFEVRDTGVGMAAEEMSKLFRPFEQTFSGNSRGGTGLGLTISKEYVALMGGGLSVWSQKGKGSTFRFVCTFRGNSKIPSEKMGRDRKVVGLAGEKWRHSVLVVDDREESRLLLVELLRAVGFSIKAAVNGQQALALFITSKPDLVLMDMRMPEMDGYQATRQMKATRPEVPVIAVSASVFDEETQRILESGADDFIRKPFRENELFECIQRHLSVHYQYAEVEEEARSAVLDAAGFLRLPKDIRGGLKEALIALNVKAVQEFLGRVEDQDEILAKDMRRMVEDYQFERILDLLNGVDEKGCERVKS